jgi:hypothetical protein
MKARRQRGTEAQRAQGLCALAALAIMATPASAQSLAERVAAVDSGWAALEFAARPGVCGQGNNIMTFSGGGPNEFWESGCDAGPVRVLLTVREARVTALQTYVGGRWRADPRLTNLGRVPATSAADYLLGLIETQDDEVAKRAILPARLADSVDVWPRLVRLARDRERPSEVRKSVIFWLAHEAGERVARSLQTFVDDAGEDREVRKSAIYAISRLRDGQAVPRLMRIAREHPDPHMRKQALFWLGRSEDPRALALIEELLMGSAARRP